MASSSSPRDPDWDLYASHREHFTQAVLAVAPSAPGRLCVLGAGKCNDLDLTRLTQAYREVHLVDLAPAYLAAATSREAPAVRAQLTPHAPVDLAIASPKKMTKWQRKAPSSAELATATEAALSQTLLRLPAPFDVVVSACVMTQLGFALTQAFGESNPLLAPLRQATAQLHLQTLLALTATGGTALFVSDLASSSHYPLDTLPADANLEHVCYEVVRARAFYQLANPDLILKLLGELTPEAQPKSLQPWLWTGPRARTYLVYGYQLTRA